MSLQGDFFSSLVFCFLTPWQNKDIHRLEQTYQNLISTTLTYGPWSGWNPSFLFCFTELAILGSINDSDMNIFGFSH